MNALRRAGLPTVVLSGQTQVARLLGTGKRVPQPFFVALFQGLNQDIELRAECLHRRNQRPRIGQCDVPPHHRVAGRFRPTPTMTTRNDDKSIMFRNVKRPF